MDDESTRKLSEPTKRVGDLQSQIADRVESILDGEYDSVSVRQKETLYRRDGADTRSYQYRITVMWGGFGSRYSATGSLKSKSPTLNAEQIDILLDDLKTDLLDSHVDYWSDRIGQEPPKFEGAYDRLEDRKNDEPIE